MSILPPLVIPGRCQKCGLAPVSEYGHPNIMVTWNHMDSFREPRAEHMERECERCGYVWHETVEQ